MDMGAALQRWAQELLMYIMVNNANNRELINEEAYPLPFIITLPSNTLHYNTTSPY